MKRKESEMYEDQYGNLLFQEDYEFLPDIMKRNFTRNISRNNVV